MDKQKVSGVGNAGIHETEADELYNLTKVIPNFSGRGNGVAAFCRQFIVHSYLTNCQIGINLTVLITLTSAVGNS